MPLSPRWLLGLTVLLAAGIGPAAAQVPAVVEWINGQPAGGLQRRPFSSTERSRPTIRTDEQLLESFSFPTDGPGLIQFFHKRTLKTYRVDVADGRRTIEATGQDRVRIAMLVRRLGDELFN